MSSLPENSRLKCTVLADILVQLYMQTLDDPLSAKLSWMMKVVFENKRKALCRILSSVLRHSLLTIKIRVTNHVELYSREVFKDFWLSLSFHLQITSRDKGSTSHPVPYRKVKTACIRGHSTSRPSKLKPVNISKDIFYHKPSKNICLCVGVG